MKVLEGATRMAFLGYFVSHIPITLFVDAQGLLGPYYPTILRDVVAWYCNVFGDVLMKNAPSTDYAWFSSMICFEIFFQLPFFFVAIQNILATTGRDYPDWFRMMCIVYGTHVSTTLVPILGTFVTSPDMTIQQKCATIAIYSPYLIFPSWLTWLAVREDFGNDDTSQKKTAGGQETKLD